MSNPVYTTIYTIIKRIPKGRVATYGQIARLAGIGQPRRVGYALRILPENNDVPWQRVINARGEISRRWDPDCVDRQRALLEKEGVEFDESAHVSLKRFQWRTGKEK